VVNLKRCVEVAKSKVEPDIVLKNGFIVNVFTQSIEKCDVAICDGYIAGIGSYGGISEVDCTGMYIVPGFIDSHVHIESSKVIPEVYSKTVITHGVTCCIADPHEIANVLGEEGINFMLESGSRSAVDIFYMLPSCVPATDFEDNGAVLDSSLLKKLMNNKNVLGLGEVMDVSSAINLSGDMKNKLDMFRGKPIDGHCPEIDMPGLNAYICCGVMTDHECTRPEQAAEKIRRGMYVMLREGSAAKNLKRLLPAVNYENYHRFLFCTDDKDIADITGEGTIDHNIREAVAYGINPVKAVTIASLNAAQCYGLKDRGAVAPGFMADIVVLRDLEELGIEYVIKNGKIYEDSDFCGFKGNLKPSMNIKHITGDVLKIRALSSKLNVIKVIKGSIETQRVVRDAESIGGIVSKVISDDVVKAAAFERHKGTGKFALGFIEGLGLKGCSIAQSISHDSHNIIAAGDDDRDMEIAVNRVIDMGGGICIASSGKIMAGISLPFGGLMTCSPSSQACRDINLIDSVLKEYQNDREINIPLTLSFMSLPVIPELKITDRGLYDYYEGRFINLFC
jgi:adenine deaminase